MRVLFTTQPGLGHLHPLLPVASEFRRSGAEVAFASSPLFVPQIEAEGFATFPAGVPWTTSDMASAFPDVAAIPPGPQRYAWARSHIFADRTAIASASDVIALARRWHPDVIVREAAEYGGCLAAERLGLPHAVVRSDTASASFTKRAHVAGSLETARARIGLPPDPHTLMPFRYLSLSFAPAGLDDPLDADAPTYHPFRPAGSSTHDRAAPGWLGRLGGRPTVYVTLGTVFNHNTELFGAIIAALATQPVNVVVTIGRDQDPEQFGPQPDHIHIERWIDQEHVLAHADVVITHGGYGTVSAALTRGLPLVVLPISADQPLNAARCVALGVGRTIEPCDRTPAAVRAATLAVLDDVRYRRAAQRVADETRKRPGLDEAIELVEQLARDRLPRYHRHPTREG